MSGNKVITTEALEELGREILRQLMESKETNNRITSDNVLNLVAAMVLVTLSFAVQLVVYKCLCSNAKLKREEYNEDRKRLFQGVVEEMESLQRIWVEDQQVPVMDRRALILSKNL